jgi:hypothetical protein
VELALRDIDFFFIFEATGAYVFDEQNPLPIATVDPRPSQVVRSAPLGVPYSELQQYNVLGPVPEVDVMAKRPQGLLNVGDSFRADGGAAFLRS